jgi:hypothetical protein
MSEIIGKLDIRNSEDKITTISLDGDNGIMTFYDEKGTERMKFEYTGSFVIRDDMGRQIMQLFDTGARTPPPLVQICGLNIGADDGKKPGVLRLRNNEGNDSIVLDGKVNLLNINDRETGAKRVHVGQLGERRIFGTPLFGIKLTDKDGEEVFYLDGNEGSITIHDGAGHEIFSFNAGRGMVIGGKGRDTGHLLLIDPLGKQAISLGYSAETADLNLGSEALPGKMVLRDRIGGNGIVLNGSSDSDGPRAGYIAIQGAAGTDAVVINGYNRSMVPPAGYVAVKDMSGKDAVFLNGSNNSIALKDKSGKDSVILDGKVGNIVLPNAIVLNGANNSIALKDKSGRNSIILDGNTGDIVSRDKDGKYTFGLNSSGISIGASEGDIAGTKAGHLAIRSSTGFDAITLDGITGDIRLRNSDCAEEFEVVDSINIEPGTVMVINKDGKLHESTEEYDNKVAGVISGGGEYKPGILLGKDVSRKNKREPIALIGKVFCKVDAVYSEIEIGDILTTSRTPGHAMKATDSQRSFGAIIGKALGALKEGKGLIPILISLQ